LAAVGVLEAARAAQRLARQDAEAVVAPPALLLVEQDGGRRLTSEDERAHR
jgi:hypothetical protein